MYGSTASLAAAWCDIRCLMMQQFTLEPYNWVTGVLGARHWQSKQGADSAGLQQGGIAKRAVVHRLYTLACPRGVLLCSPGT